MTSTEQESIESRKPKSVKITVENMVIHIYLLSQVCLGVI